MKISKLVEALRNHAVWLEEWDNAEAQLLQAAAKKLEKQQKKIKELKGQIPGRPESYLDVEKFYEED